MTFRVFRVTVARASRKEFCAVNDGGADEGFEVREAGGGNAGAHVDGIIFERAAYSEILDAGL